MSLAALGLVLCAAGLHAGWNALAKRGGDQVVFLWLATLASTIVLLPFGLWSLATAGLPAAAVPFVLATIVLHALYFYALGRAYAAGAYSLVYPVARGLGVALVPIVALGVFDERLSALGTLGIALVLAGIVTLHAVRAGGPPRGAVAGTGLAWAIATGLTIASYSSSTRRAWPVCIPCRTCCCSRAGARWWACRCSVCVPTPCGARPVGGRRSCWRP